MATIKSIEEKAQRFDEASKWMEGIYQTLTHEQQMEAEAFFPELKESEDERIIKALYKMAKVPRKEIYEAEGITKEQALAWLEKQGEQKPQGKTALEAINEEKVDNANKVEPRQEELTEFERAVKQVMEEAIECGDTHNLKADAEMLLSLVHNSSWSEEDEKLLDKVIKRLHKYSAEDEEYLDKYYWLIELKHRVQPQNTWKPSDEQIKVLVEVLIFAANHESPHWQNYIFGILKNLTRQLMKLREE